MNGRNETLGLAAVAVLVIGLLAYQFLPGASEGASDGGSGQAQVSTAVRDASELPAEAQANGTQVLYDRVVLVDDLPPEAVDTLLLIDDGGPYPYQKDGSTFQNREGRLPDRPRGHYREFTVETPGSPDRGARRIVAGDDGELYWTGDHYDSFAQIVDWSRNG